MNPFPLIDPRLQPHLEALFAVVDEVLEDWACNDIENGDAMINCELLYELNAALEAIRENLEPGELLS